MRLFIALAAVAVNHRLSGRRPRLDLGLFRFADLPSANSDDVNPIRVFSHKIHRASDEYPG